MIKKIGKLEAVKRIGLIFRDLEIKVNGTKFYNRIKYSKIPKDIKKQIGKEIIVSYEERITPLTDWMADRVIFLSFGIPRHYNQISEIEVINYH